VRKLVGVAGAIAVLTAAGLSGWVVGVAQSNAQTEQDLLALRFERLERVLRDAPHDTLVELPKERLWQYRKWSIGLVPIVGTKSEGRACLYVNGGIISPSLYACCRVADGERACDENWLAGL